MKREDIIAGDKIAFNGGRRVSSVSGLVLKANRVNLTIETEYMGQPMTLKVSRYNLDGEGRILRDGVVHVVPA